MRRLHATAVRHCCLPRPPSTASNKLRFKNRQQQGQRAQGWHTQTFVEKSRFLREDGKWLYVDGEQDWKKA